MMVLWNERGVSKVKVFFWLLVLFVVTHIGIKLVMMYMDAWKMEDEVNSRVYTAQVARPGDDELRKNLAKYAASLDLPLQPEDFLVTRDEDRKLLKIRTAWNVEVKFFWGVCGDPCIRLYHFEISKEGKY